MEPICLEDLFRLQFLSGPQLSPNGAHCAFLAHRAREEENDYTADLWVCDVESGACACLVRDAAPKDVLWRDDATLLYAKKEGDKTQFYAVSAAGGAPCPAFRLPAACGGTKLLAPGVYLTTVTHQPPSQPGMVVLEEIPFWANGAGYTSGKRTQLYVYREADGGFAPVSPENAELGIVSTCGTEVLYSVRYRVDRKMKFAALRRYDAATGKDEELVGPDVYDIFWAARLEDAILLYATDMKRFGNVENPVFYRVDPDGLVPLADWDEGPTNDVGSDARYGASAQYSADGKWLYYILTLNGCSQLARVDKTGRREVLTNCPGTVDGVSARAGRVVYLAARDMRCAELYTLEEGKERKRTGLNDDFFAARAVQPVEQFPLPCGDTVSEGFVLKPAGFDPAKRYPAVLEIHGGPKFAYGPVFFHEMQLLSAQGYFVLFCNPRGSDGHGNAFMDIRGRYGCEDYDDLMAFTDEALRRYPQIDPSRVAVAGGSYGGFMVNWIIGHTHRFACAVSQRSISNMVSMFCAGDTGYRFIADQADATPWTDAEALWRQSPLRCADKAKTPTLFLHSSCDYRCPLAEGLQMFTALRYHGIESRMCILEGENHGLSRDGRPLQRRRRLEELLAWIRRFTACP